MSSISVDVEVDDIIDSMSNYDRRRFLEEMKEAGYISGLCVITNDGRVQASNRTEQNALYESTNEFNRALQNLYGNGWRLSKEEEEYIIKISERFRHL